MKRLLFAVALCLGVSGCITSRAEALSDNLKTWVGHDVHDVISAFGSPTAVTPNGGSTIYEWRSTGASHANSGGYGPIYNTAAWTDTCREWFDVDNTTQRVVGWHWQGRC